MMTSPSSVVVIRARGCPWSSVGDLELIRSPILDAIAWQALGFDYECVGMSDKKEASRKFTKANFPGQTSCFWASIAEAPHACYCLLLLIIITTGLLLPLLLLLVVAVVAVAVVDASVAVAVSAAGHPLAITPLPTSSFSLYCCCFLLLLLLSICIRRRIQV